MAREDNNKLSMRHPHKNSGVRADYNLSDLREFVCETACQPLHWWPNVGEHRGGLADEFGWTETSGSYHGFRFTDD